MTAHLVEHVVHASFWLVVLAGLRLGSRRRRRLAAVVRRRWTAFCRSAAALWRGLTFHPRKPLHPRRPRHASPERTA